jgi:hypothetical protein
LSAYIPETKYVIQTSNAISHLYRRRKSKAFVMVAQERELEEQVKETQRQEEVKHLRRMSECHHYPVRLDEK